MSKMTPFLKCFSVVDERSAMYFAIGLYLQTGEIVATSCTSAQATRNYIPGLTEAFYKEVPILAITMENIPALNIRDICRLPIRHRYQKIVCKKHLNCHQFKMKQICYIVLG